MERAREYRRYAAGCLEIAHAAKNEQLRAIFLKMAEVWLDLARKNQTGLEEE
jgi:hypothetical protein